MKLRLTLTLNFLSGHVRFVPQFVQYSELDFHIWDANSQSFAWAKSKTKMAAHGGKFCTSVPVLYATLISFCLVRL